MALASSMAAAMDVPSRNFAMAPPERLLAGDPAVIGAQ
jgi:hypothetical protein